MPDRSILTRTAIVFGGFAAIGVVVCVLEACVGGAQ